MKKYILTIIGILIVLIGCGMFCFGVSMFAYQGPPLSPFQSKLGEISFIWWLPTILLGGSILFTDYLINHS